MLNRHMTADTSTTTVGSTPRPRHVCNVNRQATDETNLALLALDAILEEDEVGVTPSGRYPCRITMPQDYKQDEHQQDERCADQ